MVTSILESIIITSRKSEILILIFINLRSEKVYTNVILGFVRT